MAGRVQGILRARGGHRPAMFQGIIRARAWHRLVIQHSAPVCHAALGGRSSFVHGPYGTTERAQNWGIQF
eukprot:9001568-Lingulodinium_polyedra.AAC.1